VKKSTRIAAALIGAGIIIPGIGVGMAQADPTPACTTATPANCRQIALVGSDTTQDVMNGMSDVVTIGGVKVIASYNATGTATIQTQAAAACAALARPNGSGAGRTALLNSLTAGDGCIQGSRSSALNIAASTPGLTYIPFAKDGVGVAILPNSVLPRQVTKADLTQIYQCNPAFVGPGPNFAIHPVLPQAGSGTRSFWEGQMGITDAQVNAGTFPCIINGSLNGQIIEEHSATFLDPTMVVPFSIPQFNSQNFGVVADKRGGAILGVIDGTYPNQLNGSFSITRDVYNVIPTSKVGVAPYSTVFVGSTSLVCQNPATILKFGFATNPNCGDTSQNSGP
jgi:hypothetical protein